MLNWHWPQVQVAQLDPEMGSDRGQRPSEAEPAAA
jgi:hypothetical protein